MRAQLQATLADVQVVVHALREEPEAALGDAADGASVSRAERRMRWARGAVEACWRLLGRTRRQNRGTWQ